MSVKTKIPIVMVAAVAAALFLANNAKTTPFLECLASIL